MSLNFVFGCLALLSLGLTLWQWLLARRFPLHQRPASRSSEPPVTLLKPLKGCDSATENCLRSWFSQSYAGPSQLLFGVASAEDPVCALVNKLMTEFPKLDAQLIVCGPLAGTNLKVSKLMQLERLAKHEVIVVSDADVRVPIDFLQTVVMPLEDPKVGLVNCFYRLANPSNLAMEWEAVAINADFWGQVLQSQSLKPLDFALGAVMGTCRKQLSEIGGFGGLADCLADDYQLGKRIAGRGYGIVLSPVVVECWSEPMNWGAVWKHQLRWARTIRVCQPVPYFFSILSNGTLWPLIWIIWNPGRLQCLVAVVCCLVRMTTALHSYWRLTQTRPPLRLGALAIVKDLLQTLIWLLAFLGNRIEWRGEQMRLRRDGTLVKA